MPIWYPLDFLEPRETAVNLLKYPQACTSWAWTLPLATYEGIPDDDLFLFLAANEGFSKKDDEQYD